MPLLGLNGWTWGTLVNWIPWSVVIPAATLLSALILVTAVIWSLVDWRNTGGFWRLQAWKFRNRKFWFQRKKPAREFPTVIVEGKPGEGKTLYLSKCAVEHMRKGWRVVSNLTVRDPVHGTESLLVSDWIELMQYSLDAFITVTPTVFVIDELPLWGGNARDFKETPKFVLWLVQQHRHLGVGFVASAQNLKQVEVAFRRVTDKLVRIRCWSGLRIPLFALEEVEPETVDSDNGYTLSAPRFFLMPWWAFSAYSTQETMHHPKFRTDAEYQAEITRIQEEATEHSRPGLIQSFWDEWATPEAQDLLTLEAPVLGAGETSVNPELDFDLCSRDAACDRGYEHENETCVCSSPCPGATDCEYGEECMDLRDSSRE